MKCKICNSEVEFLFKGLVLNKYNVDYFKCPKCSFIETEKPYWLSEAYDNAITSLDVGLVTRNLGYGSMIAEIIRENLNPDAKFLDYAGGYGLFVRLMRDKGFNFYRQDKYCDNIFANNFDLADLKAGEKFEALTAFEVFEHLESPIDEIKKMLSYSDNLIFSTELQPKTKLTGTGSWWYFTPETGQHIAFFAKKTLEYVAKKYHLFLYSNGSLHMLTKKKFSQNPLKANGTKGGKEMVSLLQSDYELAKKLVEKTAENKKGAGAEVRVNKSGSGVDRLVAKMNLLYAEISILEKDKMKKSSLLRQTESELNSKSTELEASKMELTQKKEELEKAANELGRIYGSKSWKVAQLFHKSAMFALPPGSKRRAGARVILGSARSAFRGVRTVKNKVFENLSFLLIMKDRMGQKKRRNINKNSKKIVYIGHSYHQKTQSTGFLLDYLKQFYDVKIVLDESWRGEGDPFPDLSFIDESYLGVIFFQNLPSREILDGINNDNILFFPMYDATSGWDYGIWRNFRDLRIVNFSSTLHKKLSRWGFESMSVQYFPEPHKFVPGKENELFFWQRLTMININTVTALLGKGIKIHLHKAIDPVQQFVPPTKEQEKQYSITYSEWFQKREEMWDLIREKAIYFAPREYEGIGLSFLEPMAMGKAVIAVNNPTMNEYIVSGKTGYLFDLSNPKKIDLANLKKVQKQTYDYMKDGYRKWETDKKKIIDFIEGA